MAGIKTGFEAIDRRFHAFLPGELSLVASRPSMGRTALALSIAKNTAVNNSAVVFFSLMQPKVDLYDRLLLMETQVNLVKLKNGDIIAGELSYAKECDKRLSELPLIIEDSLFSIDEVCSRCNKLKRENDIQLAIVDSLQYFYMTTSEPMREVIEVSAALKRMAKELEIPVIALSALSRRVDDRHNHRPRLSDINEYNDIRHDVDRVLFIYRDEVYNINSPKKGKAEITMVTTHSGVMDTVELAWQSQYVQFED